MRRQRPLYTLLAIALIISCGCQTTNTKQTLTKQQSRWLNAQIFPNTDSIGSSPYDLEFDIEFSSVEGKSIQVKDCLTMASLGETNIAENEYGRWQLLKINCEAANRFYLAPGYAKNYWPYPFDFQLLKSFPSTSIPYLGGEGLDGRTSKLGATDPSLAYIESSEDKIKVSFDDMNVDYVLLARGDFNRDGYQDLFIRMDWYITGAFGSGHDWVVLTKLSETADPMVLWRR